MSRIRSLRTTSHSLAPGYIKIARRLICRLCGISVPNRGMPRGWRKDDQGYTCGKCLSWLRQQPIDKRQLLSVGSK